MNEFTLDIGAISLSANPEFAIWTARAAWGHFEVKEWREIIATDWKKTPQIRNYLRPDSALKEKLLEALPKLDQALREAEAKAKAEAQAEDLRPRSTRRRPTRRPLVL